MSDAENLVTLPVLPLRDIVVFPNMIVPLFVGRDRSVRALEAVMQGSKEILLVAQKDATVDDPGERDIYRFGAISTVLQLLKLPDGTVKVLVEGRRRAELTDFIENPEYFEATARTLTEDAGDAEMVAALGRTVLDQFEQYVKVSRKVPNEVLATVQQIEESSKLADTVAQHLQLKLSDKQVLLETLPVAERLEQISGLMEGELGVIQVEKKIRGRVKRQMEKTQREYYLNEQMKAIQRELGEGDEGGDELSELEQRIEETKLSKEAREKADQEMKKLRSMSPMSAEATVVRN